MASVMTEMLMCTDPDGCARCGLPEAGHGDRLGLAHFGRGREFVAPGADLRARRLAVRTPGEYELAAFDPDTGMPATSLVRATCGCGATAIATPEHASTAKCGACMLAWAEGRS
jgi:hypothetical protein